MSEPAGAGSEHLGLERGHRTLVITRKGGNLTAARRTTSARQRAEIASVQARVTLAGIGPDRVVAAEHLVHQAVAEAEAAGAPEMMCESLEVVGRCARLRDLDHARKAFERALTVADEHRLALWRIRALSELRP